MTKGHDQARVKNIEVRSTAWWMFGRLLTESGFGMREGIEEWVRMFGRGSFTHNAGTQTVTARAT
jgi:hypothetical protein